MSGGQYPSLRDWIKNQAEQLDIAEERLLFASKSRDPMWKGTAGDHRNAEWFAQYWQEAVSGRREDSVHVRGVHYHMIEEVDEPIEPPSNRTSWDQYQNTKKCYGYLKDASVVARVLGYVPLDGIRDEESDVTTVHEYTGHDLTPEMWDMVDPESGVSIPDLPEIGEQAEFRRDGYGGITRYIAHRYANDLRMHIDVDATSLQPYHVEVWSEKTPPAVLHDLAEQYGVNLVVTGTGDLSYQVAYNLAERLNAAEKPGVILYLSDFDPKGDNMAQAMAGKIAWLKRLDILERRVMIKELAVTADQIGRHGLPRTPIDYTADPGSAGEKSYQTLVNDWEERKGHGATELQALWRDEDRFTDEVEPVLETLYDDTIRRAIRNAKNEWRDDVADEITEALRDTDGLDDQLSDVDAWLGEFNDRLSDATEIIEDLHDYLDDDRYTEWGDTIDDTVNGVEFDEIELPDGEATPPDDPLYDSDRSYGENIQEVRRHEHGDR